MTLVYRISIQDRCNSLRKLLDTQKLVRIIEVHSGISALVGQQSTFNGLWLSSLTGSAVKGLPDAEVIDNIARLGIVDEICNVTSKPVIVDGDTGGSPEQFEYFVYGLERKGASAVIIEDKVFPKRNSLDANSKQILEEPHIFAQKIRRGKNISVMNGFMIIARLESLIAGMGIGDAMKRAGLYIDAGADGIMIHSKDALPTDVLKFAEAYRKRFDLPLVAVPTTYNRITDEELARQGFNIIIHANHLLRASYAAMLRAVEMILTNDRNLEVEILCTPINDIFKLVGLDRIKECDRT